MFTSNYWNERVLKYGHTGHGEPFYYCFDQEARKFAIQHLVKKIDFGSKHKALDFGCGSGDFIELLLEDFDQVSGFDISEKIIEKTQKRYAGNKRVSIYNTSGEVEHQAPYDLALSVTVLQNLSSAELERQLHLLYKNLNAGAYLVSLDGFSSLEKNAEHGLDKATTEEWLALIKAVGFTLEAAHPFYNPVLFPTPSWKLYNSNMTLRLLKPFRHFKFAQKIFLQKARKIIYRQKDLLLEQNSIFKIYILKKSPHGD